MKNINKLKYFWIVFYSDGSIFSQFDSVTGKENTWDNSRRNDIIRIGWVEFGKDMKKKVKPKVIMVQNPRMYSIELEESCNNISVHTQDYMDIVHNRHGTEYIIGLNSKEVLKLHG